MACRQEPRPSPGIAAIVIPDGGIPLSLAYAADRSLSAVDSALNPHSIVLTKQAKPQTKTQIAFFHRTKHANRHLGKFAGMFIYSKDGRVQWRDVRNNVHPLSTANVSQIIPFTDEYSYIVNAATREAWFLSANAKEPLERGAATVVEESALQQVDTEVGIADIQPPSGDQMSDYLAISAKPNQTLQYYISDAESSRSAGNVKLLLAHVDPKTFPLSSVALSGAAAPVVAPQSHQMEPLTTDDAVATRFSLASVVALFVVVAVVSGSA